MARFRLMVESLDRRDLPSISSISDITVQANQVLVAGVVYATLTGDQLTIDGTTTTVDSGYTPPTDEQLASIPPQTTTLPPYQAIDPSVTPTNPNDPNVIYKDEIARYNEMLQNVGKAILPPALAYARAQFAASIFLTRRAELYAENEKPGRGDAQLRARLVTEMIAAKKATEEAIVEYNNAVAIYEVVYKIAEDKGKYLFDRGCTVAPPLRVEWPELTWDKLTLRAPTPAETPRRQD